LLAKDVTGERCFALTKKTDVKKRSSRCLEPGLDCLSFFRCNNSERCFIHQESHMNAVSGLIMGIGLSAACGFRVFLPFLGLSVAARTGFFTPGAGFEWVGTWPALMTFSVATVLEIGSYYIPWVDNLLDTIATPAAVIAGILMTLSLTGEMDPFFRWTLAVLAGGGASGVVQGGTVMLRATSTSLTGGLGNFLVSTFEWIVAALATLLAILLPVAAFILVLAFMAYLTAVYRRIRKNRSANPA
jgi:hypothetical protein